jgi:hypothetical protein
MRRKAATEQKKNPFGKKLYTFPWYVIITC